MSLPISESAIPGVETHPPVEKDGFSTARITTVHKDSYAVLFKGAEIPAEITGKMMFSAESALDYPVCGDLVSIVAVDRDAFAVIHNIHPRKTLLKRKTSGKKISHQPIAANIDTAFILCPIDTGVNTNKAERYLVMVREAGITPILLLTKCDLASPDDVAVFRNEMETVISHDSVIALSAKTGEGMEKLLPMLQPKNLYCLLGPSGAGKTSILNFVAGKHMFETAPVREADGKGRHTTTRRQLCVLENGAMIVDTPGMRELGHIGVADGIMETFDEMDALSGKCRYSDCTHTVEQGCAYLNALEKGDISPKRYENFMKMKRESDFHEMSYFEKKKRDKAFGKMCKSVMKSKTKK